MKLTTIAISVKLYIMSLTDEFPEVADDILNFEHIEYL